MATKKAPRARGRERWVALTTFFFATLIASSAVLSPAFAASKGPNDPGNGNGKSGPAEVSEPAAPAPNGSGNGSQGQGNADHGSQRSAQGDSNGKEDQGAPPPAASESGSNGGASAGGINENTGNGNSGDSNGNTGNAGQQVGEGTPQSPVDKDGEPNKPPTEKYNGPCTRHMDPPGNGTGHDWHRGWGKGHNGIVDVEPTDPGDDGSDDEGTAPEEGGTTPEESPYLPYTPQPQPVNVVNVNTTNTTTKDPDLPDYLPYTGGEFDALLAVAACLGLMGMALRVGRPRLFSHRRIAR